MSFLICLNWLIEGNIIMQMSSLYSKRLFIGTSLLVLLFLLPMLTACGSGSAGKTVTPQSSAGKTGTSAATPDAAPGVPLGVQPCPAAVKDPAYWNPIIPTQSGVSSVASVSCGHLVGDRSLQALVTVHRNDASGNVLDVYVFTKITNATPTRIFVLRGFVKGDARISGYNTVLTAQADQLSALNAGKPVSDMTADLFREFKWSESAGTLVQTVFPGFFPDMTRYQAEAD